MSMFRAFPQTPDVLIRPIQYRDLEPLEHLTQSDSLGDDVPHCSMVREKPFPIRQRYGLLKLLSLFPNPFQQQLLLHVAECNQQVRGLIQVSPFNHTGTTWRVDRIAVMPTVLSAPTQELAEPLSQRVDSGSTSAQPTIVKASIPKPGVVKSVIAPVMTSIDLGSLLLRHCLEQIWQARTWILEIDIGDKEALNLYRHNGFQSLASMTYWSVSPEQLQELADREPDLPNLLPVSNTDAQLLYQLDTMAMPPLVRQVFDRHIQDFKTSLFGSMVEWVKQLVTGTEVVSGYVFEPQRKAAIGYFQLQLCRDGSTPHAAQLTVNPAYTWLYPELMSQMARIIQDVPAQSLQLVSPDYQPEREEYFERIGAQRISQTLLMSRSIWHKVRETKSIASGIQLSEMLQNLQPARKPIPSRMSLLRSVDLPVQKANQGAVSPRSRHLPIRDPKTQIPPTTADGSRTNPPRSHRRRVHELLTTEAEPHQEDPCC